MSAAEEAAASYKHLQQATNIDAVANTASGNNPGVGAMLVLAWKVLLLRACVFHR